MKSESSDSSDNEPKCKRKAVRKRMKSESSSSSDSEPKCKRKPVKRRMKSESSDSSDNEHKSKNKTSPVISSESNEAKPVKHSAKKTKSVDKLKSKVNAKETNSSNKKSKKAVDSDSDSNDRKPIENEKSAKKISNSKPKLVAKSFDLMSLLRLQNLHGYWEDLDSINAMLGSDISSIDGVDAESKILTKKCVATILAIAALHMKANDQRNLWMMIEQKAIKWLKKSLPGKDINKLISNIESLIN